MSKPSILGLVTARGGSQRVPGKNIKAFLGSPLLAWTISVGKESGVLDRFVLSTDDTAIALVGKQYGIEVPFMRPAELATDTASSFDAVAHTVAYFQEQENYTPDIIVLLEPSSPGRQPTHIREAIDMLIGDTALDSVTAISPLPPQFHPNKVFKRFEDGTVLRHTGARIRDSVVRGQDLPPRYYPNSSLYVFRTANLFAEPPSLWGDRTHGYIMDERYAMDIDTPEDWKMAEYKMNALIHEGHAKKN